MARRTSIEAYRKIKADGTLSQLRFEVYDKLFHAGPMTAGECWSRYFKNTRQRSSISARMSELELRGVVYQVSEVRCGYTGNTSIAWDVTEHLPIRPKLVKKETIKAKVMRLEKELARLTTSPHGVFMKTLSLATLLISLTSYAFTPPLEWCQKNETNLPMPGSSIVAGQRYVGNVPSKTNTKHLTAPATLDQADTKYILDNDITADGTAFTITASNVVLDLNKHKVVYGNKDGMSLGVTINAWNKTGLEVYNGTIEQGAGHCSGNVSGFGCNPIGTNTSSFSRLAGVSIKYSTPDTSGIYNYYGTIIVQDSTITDNGDIITNRHQGFGAIHVEKAAAQVFRNKVKARHRGISIGSNSKVYQNQIEVISHATNAAGVFAFNIQNFEVYGNQITGTGEHPIGIFFGAGSAHGRVYSNYIDVQNTLKSAEYGNTGAGCIRTTWGADDVEVSCNTAFLHGGNYKGIVGTDSWWGDSSWGRCFWLGLENATQKVKVHHNQIEAVSDNNDSYVAGLAVAENLSSAGLEFTDNVVASNHTPIGIGDNYGSAIGFPLIARNRVIRLGNIYKYANVRVWYGGQPIEVRLEDNIFTEPLSSSNVKLDGCNNGNVEVRVKDGAQSYILSDSGTGAPYNECIVRR